MICGLTCEQSRGRALSWAEEEMGGAELGDARLSRRAAPTDTPCLCSSLRRRGRFAR